MYIFKISFRASSVTYCACLKEKLQVKVTTSWHRVVVGLVISKAPNDCH